MDINDCFPYKTQREKQHKALEFVQRALEQGYEDIVISAPTGSGKTGLGVASAMWKTGYYLTGQKLLQTQIEHDRDHTFVRCRSDVHLLMNKKEYACPKLGNCNVGLAKNNSPCKPTECAYLNAKSAFLTARVALTNYAFAMTEHAWSGKFPTRELLVLDECHGLEGHLMSFLEIACDKKIIGQFAPGILEVPQQEFTLNGFMEWVRQELLPTAVARMEALIELNNDGKATDEVSKNAADQTNFVRQLEYAIKSVDDSWVFWSSLGEGADRDRWVRHQAKPVNIAPFAKPLLLSLGKQRLHMSAYPGTKDVYCRTLGLDPARVAWAGLASSFPVENRRVVMCPVGSMGRKSIEQTFPGFIRSILHILKFHAGEKGIIHCTSYALGKRIATALRGQCQHEVLFTEDPEERTELFSRHTKLEEPSVIISPSMTEGFDFANDLARFAIIAKAPFAYLGDLQVKAKMEADPDWYGVRAASTIIQSAGRIVRSEEDWGITYVLDSDACRLYDKNTHYFPTWFQKAVTVKGTPP